jgi:hypothetical protein
MSMETDERRYTGLEFSREGTWYLDDQGEANFDLPETLNKTPGVLLITGKQTLLISGTIHFGPRVGDFIHSKWCDSRNGEIHRKLNDQLKAGVEVSLWIIDGDYQRQKKGEFIRALAPLWNKRAH